MTGPSLANYVVASYVCYVVYGLVCCGYPTKVHVEYRRMTGILGS